MPYAHGQRVWFDNCALFATLLMSYLYHPTTDFLHVNAALKALICSCGPSAVYGCSSRDGSMFGKCVTVTRAALLSAFYSLALQLTSRRDLCRLELVKALRALALARSGQHANVMALCYEVAVSIV
jgi:hypothetical protein